MNGLPLVREAFSRTVRLVASARLREAVMTPLADSEDDLALLAEIEGATSSRLIAQERGRGGLSAEELVHGVPHAIFINARSRASRTASTPPSAVPGTRRWRSRPASRRSAST